MSLINKMLQDLDRRQALGAGADAGVVRPAQRNPHQREWFWRVVTLLLAIGVGWVAWTVYQVLPRPLVTELAFQAAAQARERPAPLAEAVAIAPPAPEPEKPPVPVVDELKLAHALETPIRERVPPAPAKPKSVKPKSVKPQAVKAPAAAPVPAKSRVDKRVHVRSAPEIAEGHFRRAALFLNHGRVSEAEQQLAAALQSDPAHAGARQAYVALLLEHGRVDPARRLLEEALAIDAAQPAFALALARLHAGRRDYAAALEVLERSPSMASQADFQALRAAVLQRLGRHTEAVAAYQQAIRGDPDPATSWVGLAISLEALGRKPEAAAAYRKALEVGPLAAEARAYAEARARALD